MQFPILSAVLALAIPVSLVAAPAKPLPKAKPATKTAVAAPAAAPAAVAPAQNAVTTTSQAVNEGNDGRNTTVTSETIVTQQAPLAAAPADNDALLLEYKKAYEIYQAKRIPEAKEIFKKVAETSTQDELTANALFLLANCYIRMGEYDNCVQSVQTISSKYAHTGIVQKGQLLQFAVNIIDKASKIQTNWDYWRYQDGNDENGEPVWKESVPPGQQIARINFKLPFGMYKTLQQTQPNNPYTLQAKTKLEAMLAKPITFSWIDEKAKLTPYGHPSDFFSKLGIREKKHFSEVICERMFYEWKTEKFHLILNMYDDVRNLKHRYTAKGMGWEEKPVVQKDASGKEVVLKPGVKVKDGIFSLAKLFEASTYDPYSDTFRSATEAQPNELGL